MRTWQKREKEGGRRRRREGGRKREEPDEGEVEVRLGIEETRRALLERSEIGQVRIGRDNI